MQDRREKRCFFVSSLPFCCQSDGLYFTQGKKEQQTVRISEGWEEMRKRRKVKAKNERKRKTTHRKKLIGQARKQGKKGGCCGLTVKPNSSHP